MTSPIKDPLLLAGKAIAILMQAAMAFGGIVLTVMIPVTLIFSGYWSEQIARETGDPNTTLPALLIAAIMLIGLAIVAMLFFFFDKLRRIIGTVGEGDPFQPANARRLNAMAWLILGAQLMTIPAVPLGLQLARFADKFDNAHFTVDGGLDLEGVLLAIILFILARVFRHGAAMREDLEGTV